MSSQNEMLKKDILDVLSKEISGGDVRTAYPHSQVAKTEFGLAGAVGGAKAKKKPAKKNIGSVKINSTYYGKDGKQTR